jgi:flagellar hook assembly protein FlgD
MHPVQWDGRDERGASAASGVYVVRLEAFGQHRVQRAVLVR